MKDGYQVFPPCSSLILSWPSFVNFKSFTILLFLIMEKKLQLIFLKRRLLRSLRRTPLQRRVVGSLLSDDLILTTNPSPLPLLTLPKASSYPPSSISIGAYIWGDPGSGKSMMMDILYESIPKTIPKKRVHFHAFMLDIHQRLHAYRKIHGILSRTMYHKQVPEVIPSLKLLKKSDKNSRSCALMNSKYLTILFILLHR